MGPEYERAEGEIFDGAELLEVNAASMRKSLLRGEVFCP
jgi:hypothetical protein